MLFIAILVLLSGCIQSQTQENGQRAVDQTKNQTAYGEQISFETDDRFLIFGTYYPKENARPVILLHMLSRDRHTYDEFAKILNEKYAVLSIDLRGHGQSITSNSLRKTRWEEFSDDDFRDMVKDVKGAKEFFISRGVDANNLAVIGASIGANTALNYASEDDDVKAVVLLSPGLDYGGVKTEEAMKKYRGKALIMAGERDTESARDSRKLKEVAGDRAELKIYSGDEHGTELLFRYDTIEIILKWLQEN
ncbi:MAG: alpha/beta fold hydrolase [Candidatus Aenigmarchaeota archaeon]|nr:alpha/beta fold hydrolase [Candidatus Aenigmarchaeota archaeon]